MRSITKFLLSLSCALASVIPSVNAQKVQAAQVIHVSPTGLTNGTGSAAKPFKTIKAGLKHAQAGDQVVVHGGIYHEKIHFPHSGKKKQPIILRNFHHDQVIIDGTHQQVSDDMEGLLTLKNRHHIQIQGLTIQNFTTTNQQVPVGVLITGKSSHIKLKYLHVRHIETLTKDTSVANAHAIAIYGTNGKKALQKISLSTSEIDHNKLGSSEAVVFNGNVSHFKISRNKIHDNDNIGIDMIGYEKTAAKHDYARHGVITQNELWNISTKHNPAYREPSSAAIYADGARDLKIQRNRIHNSDIGIEAASEHHGKTTKRIMIRNNLIENCRPIAGIAFGGYDKKRGQARQIKILNNTLINNFPQILVQHYAQDSSNVILNNLFADGKTFAGKLTKIKHQTNYTGQPDFVAADKHDFRLRADSQAKNAAKVRPDLGHKDLAGKKRVVANQVSFGAYQ